MESLSRFEMSSGFGCILAHSMGLGKTLQVICFIDVFLTFTKASKVLCIVPLNTIQNWQNEFDNWLPEESSDEQPSEDLDKKPDGEPGGQNELSKCRKFKVYLLSDNIKTIEARAALIGKSHELYLL